MSGAPNHFLDAAIIIETFNLREDTAFDRLRAALDYADELRRRYNGVEVILADASDIENPNEAALARLILNYPRLRTVRVPGAGYDGIKHAAILSTTARHVVFLDSDCLPDSDLWLGALVGPIQRGLAEATTGTTVYEPETLWAQVLSILDFGFLLESTGGTVSCYTSNNAAFLRERWLTTPPPDGALRCTCYGHARELMQQNAAILHVAEATARHEMKSFWSERWRRGYDLVAVCWIDRYLREARWLKLGPLAVPLFYGKTVAEDWRRMRLGRSLFGWNAAKWLAAMMLSLFIRLIDMAGVLRALTLGPSKRWTAYGVVAPSRLENAPNRA